MFHNIIRLSFPVTLLLVFFIYFQAVNGPYVVDDMPNLVNNDSLLISELNYSSIKEAILSSTSSKFHRPVSMLSFAVNYSLAGNKSPFSIKLTNILLHIIIGVGIFILSRKLLPLLIADKEGSNKNLINTISAFTGIIWLSHPLFVSTVLYAVQRMAMLSTFFVIFGCISYIYLRNNNIKQNKNYYATLLIIPFITVVGFFSKENAFLLPGFMLIIEYYCFNFSRHRHTPEYFIATLKLILWLPVIFVLSYLSFTYLNNIDTEQVNRSFDLNERVLTQTRLMWHYLGWLTFLNPEPMGIYHDDIPVSTGLLEPITTFTSILAWIVIIYVVFKLNRYSKIYSFSLLWFLWGHSLESTVIPLSMVFEHRNYLPGFGPIFALSTLIGTFLVRYESKYLISCSLFILFSLLPLSLLHERVQHWTDPQSFGLWLVRAHPESVSALTTAANYLNAAGDVSYSIKALKLAQKLDSDNNATFFNKIRILCENYPEKTFDDQIVQNMNSIPLNEITANARYYYNELVNDCSSSYVNHDALLLLYKRFENSEINKMAILSYYGKGKIHLQRNETEKALRAWETAIEINPVIAKELIPLVENIRARLYDKTIDKAGSY